MSVCIRIHWI